MKQFFKFLFASTIGVFVAGALLMVLFFGIVFSIADGAGKEKKVVVENNSILKIKFNKSIVDRSNDSPFDDFDLGPFSSQGNMGLNDILKAIEQAKKDDKIKGILLANKSFPGGLAQLSEVRKAIQDFKESGKWVMSYAQYYNQRGYYLASVADKVYLYPEGDLEFKGLATKLMFLKGTLDRFDMEVQVIRGKNNKFKSAVEPFLNEHMSDANRTQVETYLFSIWNELLTDIEKTRGVSVAQLNNIADSLLVREPQHAVDLKLIDGLKYRDEVVAELLEKMEVEEEDDLNVVSINEYMKYNYIPKGEKKSYKIKDRVAVIYAEGEIRSGKSSDGTMGSRTISKAIRDAREDENVKAVVLRVNSPGGSALASDVMWRELELTKKEKPLIVSMGNLAASGGYYISCNADRIFADANTITGSIGVFGMIPNVKPFLKKRLSINIDEVKTNDHAGTGDIFGKMDEFEYGVVQHSVEKIYDTFISKVADGRGLTKEQVDAIGQGRVWTGKDALKNGLVDELGGLNKAIAYAVEKAELEEYKLKELPKKKDPIEEILKQLESSAKAKYMEARFGEFSEYMAQFETIQNMEGIQMRIPYLMQID